MGSKAGLLSAAAQCCLDSPRLRRHQTLERDSIGDPGPQPRSAKGTLCAQIPKPLPTAAMLREDTGLSFWAPGAGEAGPAVRRAQSAGRVGQHASAAAAPQHRSEAQSCPSAPASELKNFMTLLHRHVHMQSSQGRVPNATRHGCCQIFRPLGTSFDV